MRVMALTLLRDSLTVFSFFFVLPIFLIVVKIFPMFLNGDLGALGLQGVVRQLVLRTISWKGLGLGYGDLSDRCLVDSADRLRGSWKEAKV